jgi:hypothetical protein
MTAVFILNRFVFNQFLASPRAAPPWGLTVLLSAGSPTLFLLQFYSQRHCYYVAKYRMTPGIHVFKRERYIFKKLFWFGVCDLISFLYFYKQTGDYPHLPKCHSPEGRRDGVRERSDRRISIFKNKIS